MWRALAVPNFRLLWASEAVSVVGDQFHLVALSWLVITLTGSGLALGTVLIAIGIPRAILLLPFGVLADRRPSRPLMLAAHLSRGVIVGAIAALVVAGAASLPVLAALGALFGAADAIYMPAQQAFLPRTVSADRLPSANALLQATFQVASIAGPPVAGAAVAVVGTGAAFTVDAVSFFAAALVVLLMTQPHSTAAGAPAVEQAEADAAATVEAVPRPENAAKPESFLDALRGGVRYVVADPALRTMMLIALVLNLALNGPAAVGMPWLADRRFHAGSIGFGFMAAAWAAGALVGTVVAGNARLERQGRVILVAVVIAGAAMAAVGFLGWLPGVIVVLAAMGVAIGYTNIVAISWIQARVEPAIIGRVMSLVMLMSFGITPLSLGLSGALIDLDATALFAGAGVLTVATALFAWVIRFPALMDERRDPRTQSAAAPAA
jgi:MFS family permease